MPGGQEQSTKVKGNQRADLLDNYWIRKDNFAPRMAN
jgi:hypothetical protein